MTTATQAHEMREQVGTEPISPRPSRDNVIARIQELTGYTYSEVDRWLHWLQSTLGVMRTSGGTHYMTPREMDRYHAILDAIIPDDTTAAPGSVHAALEDLVLDRSRGELALSHSKKERFHRVYCSVTVGMMQVNMS